ncbi:MAG: penicillin-binding protein 2 [Oscillospiraceae bacterium]|nr:penicillin-binding protein 2 [Oscillospiraceae bacterium]
MKKNISYTINKRPLAIFLFFCVTLSGLTVRLARLMTGANSLSASYADEKSITLDVSRGYIYDRNLYPLVNNTEKNITAVILNDITRKYFTEGQFGGAEISSSGIMVTFESDKEQEETLFCTNIKTVLRYSDEFLCPHIIGYINSDGKGVCGIEKSFDKILYNASGRIGVKYTANATGGAIAGTGIEEVNDGYNNPSGIVLTIDKDIQAITENALKNSDIKTGAAVVLKVETGEILAISSIPSFNVNNLDKALSDPLLPFLNRALSAYPVGSVFKPFIAAAALENGVSLPDNYFCTGKTDIGNLSFRCYNSVSHGELDINRAICKSCNSYFISLGQETGAEKLHGICSNFGFGKEIRLTGDIKSAEGNLPDEKSLSSPGALANLCFGQGDLLATPLQLASAFNALASNGIYKEPYITKALINENKEEYAYFKSEEPYRAVSAETSEKINSALNLNMLEGTGKQGNSEFFSSAGKTATAQTGKYDSDGKEKLCTWFCGFFPYESPKYTIVVFSENGSSASEECAPVFKRISEGIYFAGIND